MICPSVQTRPLKTLMKFWKCKRCVRPTLGGILSHYRVMINSQGVLSRNNYVPLVTSEVTKSPIGLLIGAPLAWPLFVVSCIHICCRVYSLCMISSLVIVMHTSSSGLKNSHRHPGYRPGVAATWVWNPGRTILATS